MTVDTSGATPLRQRLFIAGAIRSTGAIRWFTGLAALPAARAAAQPVTGGLDRQAG
jgi:hypothetical protein